MSKFLFFSAFFVNLCVFNSQSSLAEVVAGEYLIKMKPQPVNDNLASKVQTKIIGKAQLKASFPEFGIYHILTNPASEAQLIGSLKKDAEIEYVEANYKVHKIVGTTPDSVIFESMEGVQQHISSKFSLSGGREYIQNLAPIGIEDSWAASSSLDDQSPILVAVIDTGADLKHSFFKNTVVAPLWKNSREVPGNHVDDDQNGFVDDVNGWNFISNNGAVDDDEGHGTHVAGIVLGAGLNIFGSLHEKSKIQVMVLKFLDAQGGGTTAGAVQAIYYAISNGAKVINNSWGGSSYSRSLHEALAAAYNAKILIVNAAGNYGTDNDLQAIYPANYDIPGSLSIGASMDTDELAYFSNFGKIKVNLVSPGVDVLSTYRGSFEGHSRFMLMSGTSMASPLVAGVAALAWRENIQLSPFQIKQKILENSFVVNSLRDKISSSARIDPFELLNAVKNTQGAAFENSPLGYNPQYNLGRSPASSEEETGGGCGMISEGLQNSMGPGGGSGFLILIPMSMFLFLLYRTREKEKAGASLRKYERFLVNSEIRVKCGGEEFTAHMTTLSEGGSALEMEKLLEKGGLLTLKVETPEGHNMMEVQGRVVWKKEGACGVEFIEPSRSFLERILMRKSVGVK